MGRINIDVTTAGMMPDGNHIALVQKIEYQVKIGEKWNKDGIKVCEFSEWNQFPVDNKRVHITLFVPGKGNYWHDLYMMESALGFTRQFLEAAGVEFGKTGFDFDDALNRNVGINLVTVEKDGYINQSLVKLWKV